MYYGYFQSLNHQYLIFSDNVPNFFIRAVVFINPLTLRVLYQHHELFSPNFVCLCCIDSLSKGNISKMLFSTLLAFVLSLLYTICFTFLLTTSLNLDLSSLDIKWPGVCECVCGGEGGGEVGGGVFGCGKRTPY